MQAIKNMITKLTFKQFLNEGWFSKKPKRSRRYTIKFKIKDSAPSSLGSIDPVHVVATSAKEAENKAWERMPQSLKPHLKIQNVTLKY